MGNDKQWIAIIVVVVVVAVGALGGAMYYRQDCQALQAQLDELAGKTSGGKITEELVRPLVTVASSRPATTGDSEELQSLNAYIDKLESENASLKQQLEQAQNRSESEQRRNARRERNRDPRQRMEELRETNPEEYERIQSRMAEMRTQMEQRQQQVTDYLANLDTSRLSRSQRETLQDFQAVRAEIQEAMADPENMDRDEMRELGREMFELAGPVRDILYEQLAGQLGTDAAGLAESIEVIQNATGFGGMGGPGGFGGRGPGGRGGFGGSGRR
ncbi:MAG: hypothetical protein II943_08545 [Victivallales bacterium]|nr:hypothetical protein [Victivallales bacterium]